MYYKNTNTLCPLCELTDDSQEHLLQCCKIKDKLGVNNEIQCEYSDIFSEDADKLFNVARIMLRIISVREELQEEIDDIDTELS